MKAYHNDPLIKADTLQMLARLEDCIFKRLPNDKAKQWPERFMSAIEPGRDLSLVGWLFLHWILTDKAVNPGIDHPAVRDAVRKCADVIAKKAKGRSVAEGAAWSAEGAAWSAAWSAAESVAESAARSAAWSARSAAESMARSAERAESMAESAESVAESAAWSAVWSARSAAWSARSVAESMARSAERAESMARSAERAAYVLMADKLIDLLRKRLPLLINNKKEQL